MLPAKISHAEVPALYRRLAPIYDLWAHLTESRARRRALELASIRDGESVLEVATGTGLTFAAILSANPGGRNEGIDVTPEMLERAIARARRSGAHDYRLRVGDAYALDYPDSSFDVLLSNYLFDLLPEQDFAQILGGFRRVLRPRGRLVLVSMTTAQRWHQRLWERIYRVNPAWLGGCRGVTMQHHLERAGFVDTQREFVAQMAFPSEIVYGVKPADAR